MRFGDWKSRQQLRNLPSQVGFQPPQGGFADVGAVSTAVFCNTCLHPGVVPLTLFLQKCATIGGAFSFWSAPSWGRAGTPAPGPLKSAKRTFSLQRGTSSPPRNRRHLPLSCTFPNCSDNHPTAPAPEWEHRQPRLSGFWHTFCQIYSENCNKAATCRRTPQKPLAFWSAPSCGQGWNPCPGSPQVRKADFLALAGGFQPPA